MAELKTIRLKKLDNLKNFEAVEGRTYYVEENNTLYRDVLSTKMAVGQVYLIPKGRPKIDNEENTLTLSNVLVISNEITNQEEIDADNEVEEERAYKIGMYDENGKYIDLSAGIGASDGKVWDKTTISETAPDEPNNIWLDTNQDFEIITTEQNYVPDYTPASIPVFTVEGTGDILEDLVFTGNEELIVPEGEPEALETDSRESGLIIPEKEPQKIKE